MEPTADPEATTPKITPASKQYGWRFWYILIVIILTVMVNQHNPLNLLLAIPINVVILFIPVWVVVQILRGIRALWRWHRMEY